MEYGVSYSYGNDTTSMAYDYIVSGYRCQDADYCTELECNKEIDSEFIKSTIHRADVTYCLHLDSTNNLMTTPAHHP